jgi:hypothetical protein
VVAAEQGDDRTTQVGDEDDDYQDDVGEDEDDDDGEVGGEDGEDPPGGAADAPAEQEPGDDDAPGPPAEDGQGDGGEADAEGAAADGAAAADDGGPILNEENLASMAYAAALESMVRAWQEPVRTTDRTPVLVCDGKRRSVAPVCAPCRAGLRAVRSPPCIVYLCCVELCLVNT